MKIYVDGKFYEKEDAVISVFDHGFLYGDGIFEGIRIYNGKIFKMKEHIDRLFMSAKAIMLDIPMSKKEMESVLLESVRLNKKENGYIRLVVSRGAGDLGINPYLCKKASVVVITGDIQLYPEEYYTKGIAIITSSVRRVSPSQFDVRIKSLNYLNNVLAKIEAVQAGCMEAVMLNAEGYVTECTGDNIFIVNNNVLYTPCSSESLLEGITRNTVMDIAQRAGLQAKAARMTQYDLYTADECFLTGTGAELVPVIKVDSRQVGCGKPGSWTNKLLKEFQKEVLK
jgi:branched-chain amino acid aminotransferase